MCLSLTFRGFYHPISLNSTQHNITYNCFNFFVLQFSVLFHDNYYYYYLPNPLLNQPLVIFVFNADDFVVGNVYVCMYVYMWLK